MPPFWPPLIRRLVGCLVSPPCNDNFDPFRHADGIPRLRLRGSIAALRGLTRRRTGIWGAWREIVDDRQSRETLLDLAAFKVLGARRVELAVGVSATQRMRAFIGTQLRVRTGSTDLGSMGWHTSRYDLDALGLPLRVHVHPIAILHTFMLDQYRSTTMPEANLRPGDVVIDGGACWGDTTLYFAHHAGESGKVVGFEFDPQNLELLKQNLELNPQLAQRIQVCERALWRESGATLSFEPNGPGTRVQDAALGGMDSHGGLSVSTCAIDDLVASGAIARIDFIKLDVEGAELEVLHGAQTTIRELRPRLAIAIYHDPNDVYVIPRWIRTQVPGYRFSIEHRTLHNEETMLFGYVPEP